MLFKSDNMDDQMGFQMGFPTTPKLLYLLVIRRTPLLSAYVLLSAQFHLGQKLFLIKRLINHAHNTCIRKTSIDFEVLL